MKTSHYKPLAALAAGLLPLAGLAQVNSGSDGHNGTLNPTSNLVIDMADHPDGVYQYMSVNIPENVTVSFLPNAKNAPVIWLIQKTCNIAGIVNLDGTRSGEVSLGSAGGPGGYAGGNGPRTGSGAGPGTGPGGGDVELDKFGGNGSYGTSGGQVLSEARAGGPYGNQFLIPLLGGSGGGGGIAGGGAGGGGAILIATSESIILTGKIFAKGGDGGFVGNAWVAIAGCGSGGAVRLVSKEISGNGSIDATGGVTFMSLLTAGGLGRIRIDALSDRFTGGLSGLTTRGFQPVIIAPTVTSVSLSIESIGGVPLPANPTALLSNPDVIIPSQQANPMPIVVRCKGIAIKTDITVEVKPSAGAIVRAVGLNDAGTQASSTATVSVNMPRGGGLIYAKAVSGIARTQGASLQSHQKPRSLAQTGWTAYGEEFSAVEVTATLGGQQQFVYLTESGKRYPLHAVP